MALEETRPFHFQLLMAEDIERLACPELGHLGEHQKRSMDREFLDKHRL